MGTREEACTKIDETIGRFAIDGQLIEKKSFGNGFINDTFLLTYRQQENIEKRYILQRMNHEIFKKPNELMENMIRVTEYLHKVIIAQGGNSERETVHVIKTKSGESFCQDSSGNYWRIISFIEDTICFEQAESAEDFYNSGVAFGNFQKMLADFPAKTLFETIPNFHNTKSRFADFKKAVEQDPMGRKAAVEKEIAFALEREQDASVLVDLLEAGKLPLRVTHNDTKLNNILFDRATKKALCIIDLDTVMPGLSVYDFGDAIRYGANTGAEDEQDLSKIEMDLVLFEAYVKGYIEGSAGSLTALEIELFPMGAKLITYENGMRFLADYLMGDIYYKVSREGQNLDRARTQFKMVADMEHKWSQMVDIVKKYKENTK